MSQIYMAIFYRKNLGSNHNQPFPKFYDLAFCSEQFSFIRRKKINFDFSCHYLHIRWQ